MPDNNLFLYINRGKSSGVTRGLCLKEELQGIHHSTAQAEKLGSTKNLVLFFVDISGGPKDQDFVGSLHQGEGGGQKRHFTNNAGFSNSA